MVVYADVGAAVGAAEEPEERLIVGQILQRADLELSERDMRAVEVDRRDAGGIGGKIGEHVAPARGDGDDVVPGRDLERLHVDDRILPDLRINELRKREGEHPLEHPGPRQGLGAVHSRLQGRAGRLADRLGGVRQFESPSSALDGSALDESHDEGVTA